MAKCAALNCTFLDQYPNFLLQYKNYPWTVPPALPPIVADPDIAGLGVILAFLISAYFTWTVVAIGYACGYVNENLLGNLDRRLIRIKPRQSDRWGPLLVKVVLMLSDQQILTGVSILTAGYAKRCTINVYHWQVVVYLAWMSSSTHLITLSVLREYLREKEKNILRVSRVTGMLVLFFMLFIAIAPTGNETYYRIISGNLRFANENFYFDWTDHFPDVVGNQYFACGASSACFWNRIYWKGWRWDAGLTYFLLISSYIARAAALFETSETFFRRNMRDRLLGNLEKALDRKVKDIRDHITHRRRASWTQKLGYHTYLATYALALACLELYSSFLAPLLWVLLNLVWGSLQLLIPRTGLAKSGAIAEENTFGFGQIVPLMLLALPLVAAFEAYYEVLKPTHKHQTPPSSPKRLDPKDEHNLDMAERSPTIQSPTERVTHGQRDDVAANISDRHLVRADTEQSLGYEHISVGQPTPGNLHLPLQTSLKWRAHHQDFYASKWFRSIQIWIIICIIAVALVLYLFTSPPIDLDLFPSAPDFVSTFTSTMTFLCPVAGLIFIMIGGVFWSKVFR